MEDLYIAIVCSSNMNRSMEAHAYLAKKGFKVMSFGTGEKVKIPGPTADKPNCYEFGVTYNEIYNDLVEKDQDFYTRNGLLNMLVRNRRLKACPERLQASSERFDVIITCEERVYDQVIDWYMSKQSVYNQPVHIINFDIKDNHEEATIGAFLMHDLVHEMANSEDLDNNINILLHNFEAKCQRSVLNCVMFY